MVKHKIIIDGARTIDSSSILSVNIYQSANSGKDLKIGSVCAAEAKINLYSDLKVAKFGAKIDVYESINDGPYKKIGTFNSEDPVSVDRGVVEIRAYDNVSMLETNVSEWLNGLTEWPYSIYFLAKSVCEQCGLTLKNADFINGSHSVQKITATAITAREIISWCAEAAASFCVADADGNIEFRQYGDRGITAGPSQIMMSSLSFADYTVSKIDAVQVQYSGNDVGTVYPADIQNPKNVYQVRGNRLLMAESAESLRSVAANIFDVVSKIEYVPAALTVPADSGIEIGDIITVTDYAGTQFVTYVMSLDRSSGVKTIRSTGNQNRASPSAISGGRVEALAGKVLNLSQSVDGIMAENKDMAGNLASLNLQIGEIATSVEEVDGLKKQLSEVVQKSDSFEVSIKKIEQDGVSKISNLTVSIDENGVNVNKSGEEMHTKITHKGLYVDGFSENVLTADNSGVAAENLTCRKYLSVGLHARFEDYTDPDNGQAGCGCFYI